MNDINLTDYAGKLSTNGYEIYDGAELDYVMGELRPIYFHHPLLNLFVHSPELLEIINRAIVYVGETMFDVDKTKMERESAFALYNEMRELVAKIEGHAK